MKNCILFKTGFLIVLLSTFTSCNDFLDVKPKGLDIAQTLTHYDGLFNNGQFMSFTYVRQQPDGGSRQLQMEIYSYYMSDEMTADAESYEQMDLHTKAAYNWDDDIFINDIYSAEWGGSYAAIYVYNVICNGVMDVDGEEDKKKAILAEARVSRAYSYMMLAQWFGKPYNESTAGTDLCVPIVTIANSIETEFNRATVKQVWDFIIKELEEACPMLTENTKNQFRVYQSAGYIFLGKAYMLTGRYEDAVTAFGKAETPIANSVIKLGLFDYNTMLAKWGYNPDNPNNWTDGYPHVATASNVEAVYSKMIEYTGAVNTAFAPTVYLKKEAYDIFQIEDHRRKFFVNAHPTGTPYPLMRKAQVRESTNVGADMPDYYLQYAEALARTGNQSKSRQFLTTLRQNRIEPAAAAIPANVVTNDDLIRFCVEEHYREYMGTGNRWFNMRRLWNDPLFQHLKEGYTHSTGATTVTLPEKRLVMRIPSRVMDFNPGWTNNE